MSIQARLVQNIDGQFIVTNFGPEAELIAAMEIRGYAYERMNENSKQRPELQGQPKFRGLLGPMWDGDAIRYEDQKSYDILSV